MSAAVVNDLIYSVLLVSHAHPSVIRSINYLPDCVCSPIQGVHIQMKSTRTRGDETAESSQHQKEALVCTVNKEHFESENKIMDISDVVFDQTVSLY